MIISFPRIFTPRERRSRKNEQLTFDRESPQPDRPGIRGVVFDKDGTLFDFTRTWTPWCEQLVGELSGGDPGLARRLGAALGFDLELRMFEPDSVVLTDTIQAVVKTLLGVLPPDTDADRLFRHVDDSIATRSPAQVVPLRPLLERLRSAGIVLGLATNDQKKSTLRHLQQAGIDSCLSFVADADSGHGIKPGPGMLVAFCEHTGLSPQHCAMVGDSVFDMLAAQSANFLRIGVCSGPTPAERLGEMADIVLDSVADLPGWLGL